jgi:DNA-binding response OmpR family regulator
MPLSAEERTMEKEKPITVLFADDEDRFRVTTAATLKRRGLQVIAVGSGYDVMDNIMDDDIDVVVLDVKMPGIDGHETLRRIKNVRPDVEVIMLTGYGELGSALESWHKGVYAYLTKPASIDFLEQRIREASTKRRGHVKYKRRVKDVMEPLSTFISTVREDQSVAEAIQTMRQFFHSTIAATKRRETLLRSILVINRDNDVIGLISLGDILRALQPPCMRLTDDRPEADEPALLSSSEYFCDFSAMVRGLAVKKVRDIMPKDQPKIEGDADLTEAVNRMLSLRVQSLLVMNGPKPVGVVRDKDIFLEATHLIQELPHKAQAP